MRKRKLTIEIDPATAEAIYKIIDKERAELGQDCTYDLIATLLALGVSQYALDPGLVRAMTQGRLSSKRPRRSVTRPVNGASAQPRRSKGGTVHAFPAKPVS